MPRPETITAEAIEEGSPSRADAATIERMRRAVAMREPWHRALLTAIAEWRQPIELLPDGRSYDYLIANEAFDWVLLAERLAEELNGRIPPEEREALLFRGALPEELSDEEFHRRIGPGKYRAHLNFIYGVRIEEALQLAVEEEVFKERRANPVNADARAHETMFVRVYSKPRDELYALFLEETGEEDCGGEMSLAHLHMFTYWLFKFRVRRGEPARVASDTRKGIVQLSLLETIRRTSPLFSEPNEDGAFVDATVR